MSIGHHPRRLPGREGLLHLLLGGARELTGAGFTRFLQIGKFGEWDVWVWEEIKTKLWCFFLTLSVHSKQIDWGGEGEEAICYWCHNHKTLPKRNLWQPLSGWKQFWLTGPGTESSGRSACSIGDWGRARSSRLEVLPHTPPHSTCPQMIHLQAQSSMVVAWVKRIGRCLQRFSPYVTVLVLH